MTCESTETDPAVRACAIALLGGAVLHAGDVTAGNGLVIDWRTVKSGEIAVDDADAFDVAYVFVTLIGPEAAAASVTVDVGEPPPVPKPAPQITAFMPDEHGCRRRQIAVGDFRVLVEPHDDDDAAQAAFTEKLAALAATVVS